MKSIKSHPIAADNQYKKMVKQVLIFILSFCFIPLTTADPKVGQDIVVIVHPDSVVESLSKVSLRAIFGMRNRTWQEGDPIKVFVMEDDDPTHIVFAKKVLQTFPYNLRRIWDRRVYSGTGQSPTVVKSQDKMREMISLTDNSIGYISREWVNGEVQVVELK